MKPPPRKLSQILRFRIVRLSYQCDQIGQFLKVLNNKFAYPKENCEKLGSFVFGVTRLGDF